MVATKRRSDLFGGPLLRPQQLDPTVPPPRPFLEPPLLGSSGCLLSTTLRLERPIRHPAPIDVDFPPDRRPSAIETPPDLTVRLVAVDPQPDLFAVFQRQRTRSRLPIAQHDHRLFRHTVTDRPFRDPRNRSSFGIRSPPRHRHQRRPHHRPRHPRTTHTTPPNQELSRSPLEPAANNSTLSTHVRGCGGN